METQEQKIIASKMTKRKEYYKKLVESMKYSHWYEWERTFLIRPRRDINGKLIFGRVWKRERYGSAIGEYDEKRNLTPIHSMLEREYATNKDVFILRLQDECDDTRS